MRVGFILFHRALITGISLSAEMLTSAASLRDRKTQQQSPFEMPFALQFLKNVPGPHYATKHLPLYCYTIYLY